MMVKNLFRAALCLASLAVGCKSDETTKTDETCKDALCYPTCEEMLYDQFEGQDYMVVRFAYCYTDSECKCSFGCDMDACAEYCREQDEADDGYCEFLSCVCTDPIPDAGDAD